MKTLIKNVLDNLDQDNIQDRQFRWEYLNYEIRNISLHFSKGIARNMKTERTHLENKLKTLETSTNFVDNPEYPETNENLIRSTNKKQMLLELEVNVIGTSLEKNLQIFF